MLPDPVSAAGAVVYETVCRAVVKRISISVCDSAKGMVLINGGGFYVVLVVYVNM